MSAKTVDTQVPLTKETRDELRAEKKGGERYEDVIRRLLNKNRPDGGAK
jgi:predicted CopG family antitoxin